MIPKILLGLTAFYLLFSDNIDYAACAAVVVVALAWWVVDR